MNYNEHSRLNQLMSEKWPAGKIPFWVADAASDSDILLKKTQFLGSTNVDIAIIGGGFTGLWTALAIQEQRPSARVIVLEAQFCGAGASGMNGGFSHGYWDIGARLFRDFDEKSAISILESGSAAQQSIKAFCNAFVPEADFRAGGRIKLATTSDQNRSFQENVEALSARGFAAKARFANGHEISSACNLLNYNNGVFFEETATLQPAKLALGLKREALNRSIEIYEQTPVLSIQEVNAKYALEVPKGNIIAKTIILATNTSLTKHRFLKKKLTNFSSYVLATKPIPEKLASMGWASDISFSTGKMFLNWFRKTADNRIIFGTGGGAIGYNGAFNGPLLENQQVREKLVRDFLKFFPSCTASDVAYEWAGAVELSADRLPFFGTLPNTRIHYGCGYSGHGVNATWIGGQTLASLALGIENEWRRLPFCTRPIANWPIEPFRFMGGVLFRAGLMAYEDAVETGRAPSVFATIIHKLPKIGVARLGAR